MLRSTRQKGADMSESGLKQAVQAQFAPSAEAYVTSRVHADQADLGRMVELAALNGDERVLDIATGGGHTALAFAPHVREVVASDLTPEMLAAAERFIDGKGHANVRYELADAEALPFGDGEFDVITCRVAAHHFGDIPRFVAEVARVLKPGGRLILVDTIAPAEPALDRFINAIEVLRDPTHVRDHTEAEWRDYCSDAGLAVQQTETWLKPIPFDDWCERMRVAAAERAELTRRFLSASPEAQRSFAIETEGGRVNQFSLHALLLVASRV
jgi:ubiquinone/menaquinone biosynthesis C-methylase UbiE